ncbi:MAG: amino acid adenylation domain-containing protein, partial [Deltaproteobacteria bacterium]|nr:amino acid adenylation domain-containing protein [Deltaproteobacteria bacterium]
IQFCDHRTTYRALGRELRVLAAALSSAGAPSLVGLLAHPGPRSITGILGILASGAAYVPIDPETPDARIVQIARQAQLTTVVCTADQLGRLERTGAEIGLEKVFLLDDPPTGTSTTTDAIPWSTLAATEPPESLPQVSPDDLAYVMFTSGTTGTPKGVMVTHRAVSLFHDWVHQAFGVSARDRFIQTSSLAFGGSIRQVFSPLLSGATVYPAPAGLTRDPVALIDFLERHRITLWNSVPTLWMKLLEFVHILGDQGREPTLPDLRWILIGGENVPADHVRRWMDRFGTRHRIANLYGSTETVVNATWHEVTTRPGDRDTSTPIGTARTGSEVFLVDEGGAPCAAGEVGEILVGGPSLAQGYLHAPELTAAAFVDHPAAGGRVYRTGDLGVMDERGVLTFVGRRDHQVQIRGNRVELQEVENALCAHPAVEAAAVVAHTDVRRQWLVAFVVPAGADLDPDALRSHLACLLPAYMLPHRFVPHDRLPLTRAGKIDRTALAQAFFQPALPSKGPPSTTEAKLTRIWCEVLGLEQVGPTDDFFALGGDSILALTVLERLRHQVPVIPRPITLYEERTIRGLAERIDALAADVGRSDEGAKGRDPVPEGEPFPLSAPQETFVLAQRLKPDQSPNWCAAVPVTGDLHLPSLQRALDQCVARQPMLRTVFVTEGLTTLQKVLPTQRYPL